MHKGYGFMKKILLAVSVAAAFSLSSVSAFAANDVGGYVGVSVGYVTTDALDELETIPGVSVDDSDTAFKVYAGYNYSANWGVEAFYADLGDLSATDGVDKFGLDAKSLGLALLAKLPVGEQSEVFVKLGYQRWDADVTLNGSVFAKGDDTDVMFGIGAAYAVDSVSIRAELERYVLDDADFDVLSVGVSYKF